MLDDLIYLQNGEVFFPVPSSDPGIQRVVGFSRQYLGHDVGRDDPSSYVLIRDEQLPVRDARGIRLGDRTRTVIWADRFKPRDFIELAEYTGRIMAAPEMHNTTLIVDATGAGTPYSHQLNHGGIKHVAMIMTAGAQFRRDGQTVYCSKSLLLETLAGALETGELTIASDLPMKDQLTTEIASFELEETAAGSLVLRGGGRGHNSDMAIACAAAFIASDKIRGGRIGTHKLDNWF